MWAGSRTKFAPLLRKDPSEYSVYDPWTMKFSSKGRPPPWRRAWQPTPAFLPGEFPWTKAPCGSTVLRVAQSWTRLKQFSTHMKLSTLMQMKLFPTLTELWGLLPLNLEAFVSLILNTFWHAWNDQMSVEEQEEILCRSPDLFSLILSPLCSSAL